MNHISCKTNLQSGPKINENLLKYIWLYEIKSVSLKYNLKQ